VDRKKQGGNYRFSFFGFQNHPDYGLALYTTIIISLENVVRFAESFEKGVAELLLKFFVRSNQAGYK